MKKVANLANQVENLGYFLEIVVDPSIFQFNQCFQLFSFTSWLFVVVPPLLHTVVHSNGPSGIKTMHCNAKAFK